METEHGANKAEEEEASLIAALGSTAESASTYEQSVLRDARLRSAPRIIIPHPSNPANANQTSQIFASSSLVPCGDERPTLPDLSSLDPSAPQRKRNGSAAAAASPHILKVLSRTRDLLRPAMSRAAAGGEAGREGKREVDTLRMKEQILLSYLTDVVGLNDDELDDRRGADGHGSERKRRRTSYSGRDYYGNASIVAVNHVPSEPAAGKGAAATDLSKSSSTSRLDRIKNGEWLDSRQRRPLKRRTLMQMKRQMRIDNGLAPLKTMEEERFDAERSRKRREERKKRRMMRQRAALGNDLQDERKSEFEAKNTKVEGILKIGKDDSERCEGMKSGNNDQGNSTSKDCQAEKKCIRWACPDDERPPEHDVDDKERTHKKVFCPLCQAILNAESDPSEFLARHIAECQKARHARGGRTLRRRTKPSVVDLSENGPGDGEDEVEASPPDETEAAGDEETAPADPSPPSTSLDDMDEFDYEERVDRWIDDGLERMGDMAERDTSELPPGTAIYEGGLEIPAWVNNRLFPYQRTGVRWMWELHCQGAGGVVGDEMGLGKTVQVSSFLGAMAASRLLDSVLILAPATTLVHWLRELSVWAPGLRRVVMHRSGESDGISRCVSRKALRSLQKWLKRARADRVNEPIDEDDCKEGKEHAWCGTGYAVVTTYDSIRLSQDAWTNHRWSYVVLDEGQKIRNPDADVTLACKRLRTPHRLLLSGTPIQNDLRELWSLFDFIFPGRLGTLPSFEVEFAEPIKRGGYSNASPMQVQLAYRCALVLRDLINPYLLRRKKKDLMEVNRMPGKTEQVLFCRLTSKQRFLYEEYLKSDDVMGVMKGAGSLLKAVTVLRKVCNHPDLVIGPNGDSAFDNVSSESSDEDVLYGESLVNRSGKLQVLSKILPLWHRQGHKVIIFTQWKRMLTIIEEFAIQKEWTYARLDGNTNIALRQKLIDKFNNDASYFCMLMTTRTGGVGLNITGANRVVLYDPDWNPQTDAQARERAWRFGQKRDVTVYRLITAGTVEEKIYQRQIFKTALSNQVLSQSPNQRRLFSQRDLKDLFTLRVSGVNDGTETGEITRGRGVIEMNCPDEGGKTDNGSRLTNNDTLETVMKTKGLCGVFDHDFVENSSAPKSIVVAEMEESARKVALRAALALKKSAEKLDKFEPTWTGSGDTLQAGVSSSGGRRLASSSTMLANLQNKRVQMSKSVIPGAFSTADDTKRFSRLLIRIRKYIRSATSNGVGPTTREILREFKDVPDADAAVFQSMLKSAAKMINGRWIEKS